MTDIFDTGALIALEGDDRRMSRLFKGAEPVESCPKTQRLA